MPSKYVNNIITRIKTKSFLNFNSWLKKDDSKKMNETSIQEKNSTNESPWGKIDKLNKLEEAIFSIAIKQSFIFWFLKKMPQSNNICKFHIIKILVPSLPLNLGKYFEDLYNDCNMINMPWIKPTIIKFQDAPCQRPISVKTINIFTNILLFELTPSFKG